MDNEQNQIYTVSDAIEKLAAPVDYDQLSPIADNEQQGGTGEQRIIGCDDAQYHATRQSGIKEIFRKCIQGEKMGRKTFVKLFGIEVFRF